MREGNNADRKQFRRAWAIKERLYGRLDITRNIKPKAPVAQWIEQWIPNPCAASSILAGGTSF